MNDTNETSTLLTLSNELLFLIYEDLEDTDLLNISQLNRRLLYTSIPFLLYQRLGYELLSKREQVTLNQRQTLFSALHTAPFVTSLPAVRSLLQCVPGMARSAHSLAGLLGRVESVGPVRLELLDRIKPWKGRNEACEPWAAALAGIMNAVVARNGSQLTVSGGSGWQTEGKPFVRIVVVNGENVASTTGIVTLEPQARQVTIEPPKEADTEVAKGIWAFWEKLKIWLRLTSPTHPLLTRPDSGNVVQIKTRVKEARETLPVVHPGEIGLESLTILSPILFMNPFYAWTLHTLNHSRVIDLAFDQLHLSHYDWAEILESLTLPHLRKLRVGNSSIAFPDLAAFLVRHPGIICLDLNRNVAIGNLASAPLPSSITPNLTSLTANPQYIAYFLQSPTSSPSLLSVTLTPDSEGMRYDYSQFDEALKRIAQLPRQRQQALSLELHFLYRAHLHDWLTRPASSVKLSIRWVQRVTVVLPTGAAFNRGEMVNLAKWFVRVFGGLENLKFMNTAGEVRSEVPYAEWMLEAAPQLKNLVKESVI